MRPTPALLAACVLALPACSADEAPDPVGDSIVVTGPAGRVVVGRRPFALRVEDTAGRAVLSLFAGVEPLGDTVYAPLGFSTGDEPELSYPVLAGSIDTNPPAPVAPARFSALEVIDATTADGAAKVTIATDDPGGRFLTLAVAPRGEGGFDLEIEADPSATAVSAAFASGADEAFHGFGGRRESTDLRGLNIKNWVLDYRYPDVHTAYYYAEPLYVSSRGYGLLLDQTENALFRLASDTEDAHRLAVVGRRMKLLVTPGAAPAVISALTAVTGRHRKPPVWSTGPTLSRAVEPTKTTADYQQAIADDLDHLQHDGLPVTAYCFEGWALLPPSFVASTIAALKAQGIHPCLYIRSFVANDIAGTQPPADYDEAIAGGFVARTKDGDPYLAPSPFPGQPLAVIDFTSPAGKQWWAGKITAMLELGADGFMDDFGEQVLSDMVFADGTTGVTTHNRYPVLQHQATREAVDAFVAAHPEREIFFFGRAGYTGSAAFENATFPGDETNDWSKIGGLRSIIPDMLNRAVGGAYGFTTDIAGYADFLGVPATKELYLRWSEAAALTPFFRVHNGPLAGPRMPWSYDAEAEQVWKDMANLHQSVSADLMKAWDEAVATGMPVVRPLWLVDAASAATPHNDDEWLLGPDLLAAPVVLEGATSREVWLPTGCWRAKGAGEALTGPRAITVAAPLGELPWFRRCPS